MKVSHRKRICALNIKERRGNRRSQRRKRVFVRDQLLVIPTHKPPMAPRIVACPPSMNLSDDYESTMRTVADLRSILRSCLPHQVRSRRRRRQLEIDFKPLQKITPAAALVLAAELHRWNVTHPALNLQPIDVELWNADVRKHLDEIGFFRLLRVARPTAAVGPSGITFLSLYSGSKVEGPQVDELQVKIQGLAGEVENELRMYDGLIEAMTNVVNHAYAQVTKLKLWWMTASFDESTRRLTLMMFDHGRGIPITLPRVTRRERLAGQLNSLLSRIGGGLTDDASLIEAAISIDRSSSLEPNRGQGLRRDIQDFIQSGNVEGRLRILSNRGEYIFTRDENGVNSQSRKNHVESIGGTFIEWYLQVPA